MLKKITEYIFKIALIELQLMLVGDHHKLTARVQCCRRRNGASVGLRL